MASKLKPGLYDCYHEALPDEPMFTALARDPDFEGVIGLWAMRRLTRIAKGECPLSDLDKVREALETSREGVAWRVQNMGTWRLPKSECKCPSREHCAAAVDGYAPANTYCRHGA